MKRIIKLADGDITIIGNNHKIPTLTWEELTEKEKKEMEYSGAVTFFRYKGYIYGLDDFMSTHVAYAPTTPDWLKEYDG